MKIQITKFTAAKSQLIEAINLFFEDRDPVSIHTLVGAALDILNDHFDDIGTVWDNNLVFHRNTIYIKDEYRKYWVDHNNKHKNFFKHADRDLKTGVTEIEFETDTNALYILEAIRCLQILEKEDYVFEPEFRVFFAWFVINHPSAVKEDDQDLVPSLKQMKLDTLQDYKKAIDFIRENPDLFAKLQAEAFN